MRLTSYKNNNWKYHLPAEIGIDGCYNIINNSKSGELFFCADEGLITLKQGKWNILNQKNLPELPENKIYYAKKDLKNRLWIGTFKGSIMIDENGKILVGGNFTTVSSTNYNKILRLNSLFPIICPSLNLKSKADPVL